MTGSNNEIEWFLARDGEQFGPLSDAELKKIIELGHLRPVDLLWRDGMDDWEESEKIFPQQAGASKASDAVEPDAVEPDDIAERETQAKDDIVAEPEAAGEPVARETASAPPEPDPAEPWAPPANEKAPPANDKAAASTGTPDEPVDVAARTDNRPDPAAIAASLVASSSIASAATPATPTAPAPRPEPQNLAAPMTPSDLAAAPPPNPSPASPPQKAATPVHEPPAPVQAQSTAALATPRQLQPTKPSAPQAPMQPPRPMPARLPQAAAPGQPLQGQNRRAQLSSGSQARSGVQAPSGNMPQDQAALAAPSQLSRRQPGQAAATPTLAPNMAAPAGPGGRPIAAAPIPGATVPGAQQMGAHGQLPPAAALNAIPGDPKTRLPHPATTPTRAKRSFVRRAVLPLMLAGTIGGGGWLAYAHGDWLLPKAKEYYQTGLQMAKSMARPSKQQPSSSRGAGANTAAPGQKMAATKSAVRVTPMSTTKVALNPATNLAVPTPVPATRPLAASTDAPTPAAAAKTPLWQFIQREYPDWYEKQSVQNAGSDDSVTKEKWFRQMTASKLVDLRRREAIFVLASTRENLLNVAASFLNNLQVLSRHSTDACYGFISHGVLNPTVLDLTNDTAYSKHLDAQNLAVLRAAVQGRKKAQAHKAPEPGDYRALGTELIARGWSKADLQLFTDPVALSSAKPAKVCKMVQDWFTAQLALTDKDAQLRLLVQSLRPVITG